MDRAPVGTLPRNSKELLQQMTDAEREEYLKKMYRWFVGSMDRYGRFDMISIVFGPFIVF